jgi:hypothetical protein
LVDISDISLVTGSFAAHPYMKIQAGMYQYSYNLVKFNFVIFPNLFEKPQTVFRLIFPIFPVNGNTGAHRYFFKKGE